ncbi:GNAT family N-acetyltransferase [Pseudoalteromonas piscicida]|uniref:GNAT family N-acetyltransferase n=1 Tax=Pseudoalteromonas piscicida TaxID=43662 RepID=A0A2A5JPG2_PSEO7|nr:GNAT family N-acetyltransferase [Pseudoalteromonas piscicida]PCK31219.1 GNAT family N-acetyltransferase [Pseudoalteromonas piscicida]
MYTLRSFQLSDKARLIAILNDPDITRYLSTKIPQPYTEQDALWWINEGSKLGYIRAICEGDLLIGCIGVTPGEFEYERSGEIGYWLEKSHWRRGVAHFAIQKLIKVVFSESKIERIFASVFDGNVASMKLLQKSGFEQEAVLKRAIFKQGIFYDNHLFAILKNN